MRGTATQEVRQAVTEKLQALDATANHQKAPAVIAGHVIQGKTGQRRQRHQHAIEKIQQLAKIGLFGIQVLRFALQFKQRLPVGRGQFAAHAASHPLQALQVGAQAVWPLGAQHRFKQALMQFATVGVGQHAQALSQAQGRLQCLRVVIVIHVARQHNAQQPRAILATLAIATKPVKVLHHPRW